MAGITFSMLEVRKLSERDLCHGPRTIARCSRKIAAAVALEVAQRTDLQRSARFLEEREGLKFLGE